MLFHIMMLSMKTAWKRESVNLSSMGKRKVSTFLADEEKSVYRNQEKTLFSSYTKNVSAFF